MQDIRSQAHLFQRAGAVVLDQDLAGGQQVQQGVAACLRAQVDCQAFLVAGIDFPVQRQAVDAPRAQWIAGFRVFDLDDLGALIGELQADHVAGDQAGQIDHADAIQRGRGGRVECDAWDHSLALLDSVLSFQSRLSCKGWTLLCPACQRPGVKKGNSPWRA